MPKKPTLIIVHGTYGCDPDWAKDDAILVKEFRKRFKAGIDIKVFEWGGCNEHLSRTWGAEKLRTFIRQCAKENPGSPIHLVGHSHGGNVILYALRDPEIEALVTKAVCLSTPFLCAQERPMGKLGFRIFTGMLFVALPFLAWWIGKCIYPTHDGILELALRGALPVGVPFAIGAWFRWWLLRKIAYGRKNVDSFELIRESFRIPALPKGKVLLLRTPGDEAGLGLGVFSFIGIPLRILYLLLQAINSLGQTIDAWVGRILRTLLDDPEWSNKLGNFLMYSAIAVGVFFAVWKAVGNPLDHLHEQKQFGVPIVIPSSATPTPTTIPPTLQHPGSWKGFLVAVRDAGPSINIIFAILLGATLLLGAFIRFMALGLAYAVRIVTRACLAPLYFAGALAMLAFGFDTMFFAFRAEITSEATPPGNWEVCLIPMEGSELLLRHGESHSDPRAVAKVVDWVAGPKA